MKLRKRISAIAAMLCIMILLTACGTNDQTYPQEAAKGKKPSETLVLTVGDHELYLNEVNYYAISFMSAMGITDETDLDEAFSQDYPTMDDALKAQFLISLRQTQILYQKALEEGVTLTDEDMAEVDDMVQNYIASSEQEDLDKFEIDSELLTEIFTIYQTVQKFEQQISKEMEVEDISYGTYYNFVFLTVEVDDNGNAVMNEDGSYVYLSEEEQESQKALAEEVRTRLSDGEDPEDLIDEYDLASTSGIVHATTDSLKETYDLQDGEISEILENDFGYIFVRMEALNDAEYSENVKNYNMASNAQEYVEEKENAWFDEFPINDDDLVEKVWDAFTFKDFQ